MCILGSVPARRKKAPAQTLASLVALPAAPNPSTELDEPLLCESAPFVVTPAENKPHLLSPLFAVHWHGLTRSGCNGGLTCPLFCVRTVYWFGSVHLRCHSKAAAGKLAACSIFRQLPPGRPVGRFGCWKNDTPPTAHRDASAVCGQSDMGRPLHPERTHRTYRSAKPRCNRSWRGRLKRGRRLISTPATSRTTGTHFRGLLLPDQ